MSSHTSAPAPASPSTSNLLRDTRGAVLVVGIVFGSLLVGALWHLASVGDAIIWRESVQDAADAAAFENAVWNARGMNVIVSINIIMSMVLAVLVIWRVVMIAIAMGIAVSALLCFVGVGCPAAVTLTNLEIRMLQLDPRVADTVVRILSGINVVEMAVASAVPVVSTAGATANTALGYPGVTPFAASASLLPNVNIEGINNAVNCLAGSKADKPGAGSSGGTPAGGAASGGKPAGSAGGGKPAAGSGGKPTADPCGGSATRGGSRGGTSGAANDSAGSGSNATSSPGSGSGNAANAAPAGGATPSRLARAAELQSHVDVRMGMPVSLPVQDGDYSFLCNKASAFVANNMLGVFERALMMMGVSERLASLAVLPGDLARNAMGVMGEYATGIFCAPMGTAPLSIRKILDKGLKVHCESEFEQKFNKPPAKDAPKAESEEATGEEPEAKYPAEGGASHTKEDWITDCTNRKKTDVNKELGGGLCAAEEALPEMECGKPAEVWDWAANGSVFMRSFGGVSKEVNSSRNDQGLEVADWRRTGNVESIANQPVGAHAEMYFECEGGWEDMSGGWGTLGCSTNAMWQIRWRARLRRVHPMEALFEASAKQVLSAALSQGIASIAGSTWMTQKVGRDLSDVPILSKIVNVIMNKAAEVISVIVEAPAGLVGQGADMLGMDAQDAKTVSDLFGSLNMSRDGNRDDELRQFIRQHGARNAAIH